MHVGRHGGGARRRVDVGRDRLRHLDVEVGRLQPQAAVLGAQQDVRQDGDRVAALDDAMHVPERPQQGRPFDCHSHGPTRYRWSGTLGAPSGARSGAHRRGAAGRSGGGRLAKDAARRQGRRLPPRHNTCARRAGARAGLFLQHALQELDLVAAARCPRRSPSRSCAPRAARWCGRARRSGGRSPAASAGSAPSTGTWRSGAAAPPPRCGAPTGCRSGRRCSGRRRASGCPRS